MDSRKKYIVTTTINPPTEALKKFNRMEGWTLIVVGDLKTPHDAYPHPEWNYLSPFLQNWAYPDLSTAIGWNKIQRRNIGFVVAYNQGAELIATVDDDNIPFTDWGYHPYAGREVLGNKFLARGEVFDPLSAVGLSYAHRGFPIGMTRNVQEVTWKQPIKADIQAGLWIGAPDIDALTRLYLNDPHVWSYPAGLGYPFFSDTISPFNSQNTILTREVIPHYFMYPGVGRFDDIFASYHVQNQGFKVVYDRATVQQKRNEHDVLKDLEAELYGYRNTLDFIHSKDVLPDEAKKAFDLYQEAFRA